ncbi:MAG: hypothetical protein HZB56_23320 [Deltaproteobacteria bacterium]|nr:hypothetical protein [Deltaproteobacteria bacterium]
MGYGTGALTATPDLGLQCVNWAWEDVHYSKVCWMYVPTGTDSVTIDARVDAGYAFGGWGSGPCTGASEPRCVAPMDIDRIIDLSFVPAGTPAPVTHVLSVNVLGFVDGAVSASPDVGLVCQASERVGMTRTCRATIPVTVPPAQVVLTATATTAGSTFAGWGGNCSGTGTCTVTVDRDVGVTAGFASIPGGGAGGSPTCGDLAESEVLARWSYTAVLGGYSFATTLRQLDAPDVLRGQHAIRAETNAAFDFALVYTPASPVDVSGFEQLRFALRALNTNILVGGSPWQGNFPVVRLGDATGGLRTYSPTAPLAPWDGVTWVPIAVPLLGGAGWAVSGAAIDLTAIARIEIHLDTWEWNPLVIDIDGVSFEHPQTVCDAPPTPPTTTITAVAYPGGTVNQATQTFWFAADVAGATFSCSLDGAPYSPCTSPTTYSALADGPHSYAVYATAGLTEATPKTHAWTVDTVRPRVISLSTTATSTTVEIRWTTNELATTSLVWGPGNNRNNTIADDGILKTQHSVQLVNLIPDSIYSMVIGGNDEAGNAILPVVRAFLTAP